MNFAENSENFCDKAVFSPFPGGTREGKKFFSGAVCLFDSGVGGLSVLFKCREILPSRKFIYYGDNVRAPYGNLPPEAICRYVSEAAEELAGYFPPALVLACKKISVSRSRRLSARACRGQKRRGRTGSGYARHLRKPRVRFVVAAGGNAFPRRPFLSVSVRFACRKNRRYACFCAGRILHGGIACAKIFFRCIRLHALRARARGDRPPLRLPRVRRRGRACAPPCRNARRRKNGSG